MSKLVFHIRFKGTNVWLTRLPTNEPLKSVFEGGNVDVTRTNSLDKKLGAEHGIKKKISGVRGDPTSS